MDEPILDERERILVERYAVDWQMGGTDLASPATLAICARLAWLERRCEQSEAALADLRGEVVLFREALEADVYVKDPVSREYECVECGQDDHLGHAADCHYGRALTATPTSAALGALCKAALEERRAEIALRGESLDSPPWQQAWEHFEETQERRQTAADAVLTMGKEGANNAETSS